MTDPITIGTAGTKFIYSADTVGKTFSKYSATAATPLAFYTVPAAKKFIILSIKTGSASTGNGEVTLKVYTPAGIADRNIDSYGSAVSGGESSQFGSAQTITCFEELTAGENLRLYVQAGNAFTTVYGVETTA